MPLEFQCAIAAAILYCSVTLVPAAAAEPAARRAPNIVLIVADDQRWDTIRALGNPQIDTPNLDRLVQRGFRFNNAYCMGSMIGAVCLPSRTMLITGQSLWRIPKNPRAAEAPPGVPLLPSVMAAAGYDTFHCGKASNSCTFGNAAFQVNIETKGRTADSATEHADRAIEYLRSHDSERPFFLYLAPPVPHDPRLSPAPFAEKYRPEALTLSKNFMPRHPFDNGELAVRDELLASLPRTRAEMQRHLADYYATISHLDYEIGRVLDELARRRLLDNTVVIYTSDQGLAVGGRHGLMGKQNLYEHVKPPLIIAGPGIPHGSSDALTYLFDLFPTICDLAGAHIPPPVEGQSLLEVMQGKKSQVRPWLFGAYRDCQRTIRDSRFKLLQYNAGGVKNTQLFDLARDPDELVNLADDPKMSAERARLEALMLLARKQFGDPIEFQAATLPAAR